MQNSPSGSGLITDYTGLLVFTQIEPGDLPGEYYVPGGVFGALTGPVPVAPGSESAAIPNGVQTRQGKLGRTRLLTGVTGVTPGSKRNPTLLQWQIIEHGTGDIVPVGNEVSVPWAPDVTASLSFADLGNAPLDFGSVRWNAGDIYVLKMTVGTIASGAPGTEGTQIFALSGESVFVALPPVVGPLGSPP